MTILRITCVVLFVAICATLIWGHVQGKYLHKDVFQDGIEQIDINSIYLTDSGVQVDFSEVIIGT